MHECYPRKITCTGGLRILLSSTNGVSWLRCHLLRILFHRSDLRREQVVERYTRYTALFTFANHKSDFSVVFTSQIMTVSLGE